MVSVNQRTMYQRKPVSSLLAFLAVATIASLNSNGVANGFLIPSFTTINGMFNKVVDLAQAGVNKATDDLQKTIEVGAKLADVGVDTTKAIASDAAEGAKAAASGVISFIAGAAKKTEAEVEEGIKEASSLLNEAFGDDLEEIYGAIKKLETEVKDQIEEASAPLKAIKDKTEEIVAKIEAKLEASAKAGVTAVEPPITNIAAALDTLGDVLAKSATEAEEGIEGAIKTILVEIFNVLRGLSKPSEQPASA